MSLLLVATLGTVIGTLLALEAQAWMPHISLRLLRATLKRLPEKLDRSLRERWSEEIEADLLSFRDRPLGGLIFVIRLCIKGARDLAAELALQEALKADAEAADDSPEEDGLSVMPTIEINLSASRAVLEGLLRSFLKDMAMKAPEIRQRWLAELRASLVHSAVRRALYRLAPPNLNTEEGLRVAILLQELREEVEKWDNHE